MRISRKYLSIIALLAGAWLLLVMTPTSVLAAPTCTTDCYVAPGGNDSDAGDMANPLATIQAAIDAVSPGGTVHVAAGTYTENLIIDKALSLVGAGESDVTIDASGFISYSIEVRASDVTLDGFTLNGNPTGNTAYGIKIARVPVGTPLNNIAVQNITVNDSRRTGVDLNGVDGAMIDNVTVNNVPSGNGFALTDSSNITAQNLTTSNNAWGGFAIYTSGTFFPLGSDNVTITGSNSFGEPNKVYVQRGNSSNPSNPEPVTNLTVAGFDYTVMNDTFRAGGENFTFYQITQADAIAYALALTNPHDSYVNEIANGHFWVGQDASTTMTIQTAIEKAVDGDTINVLDGTYNEKIYANKSVTVLGPNAGISPNTGSRVAEAIITTGGADHGVHVDNTNESLTVVVDGLTIDNVNSPVFTQQPNHTLTFTNNIWMQGANHFYIQPPQSFTFVDNYVTNMPTSNGIFIVSDGTPNLVTITDNVWENIDSAALNINDVTGEITRNRFSNVRYFFAILLAGASGDLDVHDNQFDGYPDPSTSDPSGTGIRIWQPALTGPVNIYNNNFTGLSRGITAGSNDDVTGQDFNIYNNNFVDSTFGVRNTSPGVLNATQNWWNAASGPSGEGTGAGSAVSENVNFCPWLDAAFPGGTASGGAVAQNIDTGEYFCSIQAAIDDSDTLDGHTIEVFAGTFAENLTVDKELTLDGDGVGSTILDTSGFIISIVADNVTVADMTVQNGTQGARLTGTLENITFDNMAFEDQTSRGIEIAGATVTNLTVTDSRLATDDAPGIRMSSTSTVDGFTVTGSTFDGNNLGIYQANDGNTSTLRNVDVRNNAFMNHSLYGIYVEEIRDAIITENTFTNDLVGFYIYKSYTNGAPLENVTVTNNTFTDNPGMAIRLLIQNNDIGANISITNNTINQDASVHLFWYGMIDINVIDGNSNEPMQIAGNTVNITGSFGADQTISAVRLLGNVDGVNIIGNNFNGNGITTSTTPRFGDVATAGVSFVTDSAEGLGTIPAGVTVNVTDNIITGFQNGVSFYDDVNDTYGNLASTNVTVNQNDIAGNSVAGVNNDNSSETVDATHNWWGDASGPSGEGSGSGDTVSTNVAFCPWLTDSISGAPVASGGAVAENIDTGEYFCSIQAAIDDSDTDDGDTIEVFPGTYAEALTVDKELTLNGNGAVLDGSTLGSVHGARINTGNVTFNNFEVRNFADGITVGYPLNTSAGYWQNIKITDNIVDNIAPGSPHGFGIYVGFEGEAFNDSRLSDHLDFTGLEITGNAVSNTTNACLVLQSIDATSPMTVSDNSFTSCGASGTWFEGARNINYTNNTIDSANFGLYMSSIPDGFFTANGTYGPQDLTITDNTITNNTNFGVGIYAGWPETIDINNNDITGNGSGVDNFLSEMVDATVNWWGDASGPAGEGPGSGDTVSTNVAFCPWLDDSIDNSPSFVSTGGGIATTSTDGHSTPYCTIEEAMFASSGANQEVHVTEGTWVEETMTRDYSDSPDLRVLATGNRANTIVNGVLLTGSSFDGLTFENFTFAGDHSAGFSNYNVAIDGDGDYEDLTFLNNVFDGENDADRGAIFGNRGWNGFTLDGNTFTNFENSAARPGTSGTANYSLIFMEAQTSTMGDGYTAVGNTFEDVRHLNAIEAYRWKNVNISNNDINGVTGRILVWSLNNAPVDNVTIDNNDITLTDDNADYDATGIATYYLIGDVNVTNNAVNGADTCLNTTGVTDLEVLSNQFSSCDATGLFFDDSGGYVAPVSAVIETNTFNTMPVGAENNADTFPLNVCNNTFINVDDREFENPGPFETCFGDVTVVKNANPNAAWLDFDFEIYNVDTQTVAETFTLDGSNDGTNNVATFTLEEGTYTITETDSPGNWDLTNLTCVAEGTGVSVSNFTANFTLTPNADITCTFTNERRGQVEITKYEDLNGNGDFDDEPTLEGWEMFLYQDQDGEFVQIQTREVLTNSNGVANYTSLVPGTYLVCEEDRDGWTNSNADTMMQDGRICQEIEVDYAQTVDVHFGNMQNGSVTIVKATEPDNVFWLDFSFTGDFGDFTLNGGIMEDTNTITFDDVAPLQDYTVTEINNPGNWSLAELTCESDSTDAPDFTRDGDSAIFSLTQSGEHLTCTFENNRRGQVQIVKFQDDNENGIEDGEESRLAGWQMFLYQEIDGEYEQIQPREVRTNDHGIANYTNLENGNYYICEEDRTGWTNTQLGDTTFMFDDLICQEFVIDEPGEIESVSFGNVRDTGFITVIKYHDLNTDGRQDADEPRLDGWAITIYDENGDVYTTGTTGANGTGRIRFNDVPTGDYTVCETMQDGWIDTNRTNNYYENGNEVCRDITVTEDSNSRVVFANALLPPPSDTCGAIEVVSFEQGNDRNGNPIVDSRSNPEQALGAPQMNDTLNFVALGFGGELVLQLDGIIEDGDGDDLYIVETSFGDPSPASYPETVEVYGALALTDGWTLLGTLTLDGGIDLDGALDELLFIRLVDISDTNDFNSSVADGYDVDGILCEEPNTPPNAEDDSYLIWYNQDRDLDVLANDNDDDSDTLDLGSISAPSEGTAVESPEFADIVRYTHTGATPVPGGTTTDSFTYVVSDGNGGEDTATVNLTIARLDIEPVCELLTEDTVTWQVYNPTETSIGFAWMILPDGNQEGDTADPGYSTFTSDRVGDDDTIEIRVGGATGMPLQDIATIEGCEPPTNDLTIVKLIDWNGVEVNNAVTFEICVDGEGCRTASVNNNYSVTWHDLPLGEYHFSETYPGDQWTVEYPGGQTAVVNAEGENVYYVRNTHDEPRPEFGSVSITKVVDWNNVNPDRGQMFTLCLNGGDLDTPLCDTVGYNGGTVVFGGLTPGETYNAYEHDPGSQWTPSGGGHVTVVANTTTAANNIHNRHAAPPPPPTPVCEGVGPQSDLSGYIEIRGGEAIGYVTNNGDEACTYPIGLASYYLPYNGYYWQTVHQSHVGSVPIAPGETVELRVPLPDCATQVDLFYGDLIAPQLGNDRYGSRLLDWVWLNTPNWCPAPDGMPEELIPGYEPPVVEEEQPPVEENEQPPVEENNDEPTAEQEQPTGEELPLEEAQPEETPAGENTGEEGGEDTTDDTTGSEE